RGVGGLNTGHAGGGGGGSPGATWIATPQVATAPHASVAVKLTARSPVSAAVGVQLKRLLAGFPLVTAARLPGPPLWASVTRSPASGSPALTVNATALPACATTAPPHPGAVKAGAASLGEQRTATTTWVVVVHGVGLLSVAVKLTVRLPMSATVGVQLSVPLAGLPPVALKLAAEGSSGAASVTTCPTLMSCAATVIVRNCPTTAVAVARSTGVGASNTGHA